MGRATDRVRQMRGYASHMQRGLADLCAYLPDGCTVIEVGSYAGEGTAIFLAHDHIAKLVTIDPYDNGYYGTTELEGAERKFLKVIAPHGDRVERHRERSADALRRMIAEGREVDAVYIDGSHRYADVVEDIRLAMRLVKADGIIAGHDYLHPKVPAVTRAVDELIGRPDVMFGDYSWLKFKNRMK